jgi:hypothetical protein
MLSYQVIARIYCGHTVLVSPRQGAEPVPTVVNRLMEPGEVYRQCGKADCQCAAPMVSTALTPADEETRLAVVEQKRVIDANRRAANAGTDPAMLRARIAELEAASAKARVAELENQLSQQRIKDLEAQVAAQAKPAAPPAQARR